MRNASGHQCRGENEWQRKKSEPKNAHDISSKERVTKKFLEVSRCSHAKQRQNQKCAARAKLVLFCPYAYCCFFTILVAFAA